jgi:hypothetical protein
MHNLSIEDYSLVRIWDCRLSLLLMAMVVRSLLFWPD